MTFRKFKINKRNGKFRTIYAPDDELKQICRGQLNALHDKAKLWDTYGIQHGFMRGKSPVTNALEHRGFAYTLSMDLKDFFDSVKERHIPFAVDTYLFPDGAARQGLPTSPLLANIAAHGMDQRIMSFQKRYRNFINFVYTRYADDLTFSSNSREMINMLSKLVPAIATNYGFAVNESKTKIQSAHSGRRMITGIAVDANIHVPRNVKRRLRAMKHQLDRGFSGKTLSVICKRQSELKKKGRELELRAILKNAYNGLVEWSHFTTPIVAIDKKLQTQNKIQEKISLQPVNKMPYFRKILI